MRMFASSVKVGLSALSLAAALALTCSGNIAAAQSVNLAVTPASGSTSGADKDTALHKIRGFLPDLDFTLTGPEGKPVTQDDFRGKIVMLFFGYASCPDICPTTMAQLAQVMQNLGDQAERVRIVFVSVDPHRDTPAKLAAYVRAFDSHAIGLTGTESQIADFARRYRVAYQIEKPKTSDTEQYEVAHSRGVYIFDGKGRARLLAPDTESVSVLTQGVKELLAE